MSGGRVQPQGYTIVEVMIFLAVTGTLFIFTVLLMGGQQRRTEFAQSVREFETRVQDIINDVSTGYYSKAINFTCQKPGGNGPPVLSANAGADSLGSNEECIFIGRALQFTDTETYYVHSLIGLKQPGGITNRDVQDLTEARPTSLYSDSNGNLIDGTEDEKMPRGLLVRAVRYESAPAVSTLAFFDTFTSYDGSGNLVSGKGIDVLPIKDTTPTTTVAGAVAEIQDVITYVDEVNPSGGVIICLQGSGTSQFATLTIGRNNQPSSTELLIDTGQDCSA